MIRRENKEDFEGFLGEEFDPYTTSMAQLGTWGDELTLVSTRRVQFLHCEGLRVLAYEQNCQSSTRDQAGSFERLVVQSRTLEEDPQWS